MCLTCGLPEEEAQRLVVKVKQMWAEESASGVYQSVSSVSAGYMG